MRIAGCLAVSLSITACSGDKDPPRQIIGPDAAIDAPKPCGAEPSYAATMSANQYAVRDADTNPTQMFYGGALNEDPLFDELSIQLFKGVGAFAAGEIGPAAVLLTNDEANYETCGACVLVYVDLDPDNDFIGDGVYMATGGRLNITSVSPNLTGTVTNATFTHVTIDEDTFRSTPIGDCDASVASFAFDIPVETQGAELHSKKSRLRKPAR